MQQVSLGFVLLALGCLLFADIEISTLDPWTELGRFAHGLVTPDFTATDRLFEALLYTVSFALLGVVLGTVFGFGLSLLFHWRVVRVGCAVLRAVHELFWALIFLQILGLTPWTGILAIAIPYAGIIAKVYAEILEESDPAPLAALPNGTGWLSAFLYARLPEALRHFQTYSLYRLECGLRSSAVLGFIGLPTVGYHLESAFSQGFYSEVSALLLLFYLVIASIRLWVRKPLLPVYVIAALVLLPEGIPSSWTALVRFFTHDIVPAPLRNASHYDAQTLADLGDWLRMLWVDQILPGTLSTLLLTMIALVGTGLLTLSLFPLVSPRFLGPRARLLGHVALVVLRSTPEYILAYLLLQLWGPSMLPAIVALSLHNGGIIAHLVGRFSASVPARPFSPRGSDLYFYEVLPQVYPQFLAFLFYRWEVIFRETAILGMLGVQTLGFHVDSAFADHRIDRALVLIAVTALLNIGIDVCSRRIRARLRLRTSFDTC